MKCIAIAGITLLALTGCGAATGPASIVEPEPTPTSGLLEAKKSCASSSSSVQVLDDGATLDFDGDGQEDFGATYEELECLLSALETTEAVKSHLTSTRALDGQQTDAWGDYSARWTYHPDAGVDVIFTWTPQD